MNAEPTGTPEVSALLVKCSTASEPPYAATIAPSRGRIEAAPTCTSRSAARFFGSSLSSRTLSTAFARARTLLFSKVVRMR
ncbi:hypothetical protein [Streptomyces sp. NPDC095613]|uniref:hypothetical protein n=1 Tax=Streptomyces sp. NPDC095613 TaxID=3155540 RepID=UPI0033290713